MSYLKDLLWWSLFMLTIIMFAIYTDLHPIYCIEKMKEHCNWWHEFSPTSDRMCLRIVSPLSFCIYEVRTALLPLLFWCELAYFEIYIHIELRCIKFITLHNHGPSYNISCMQWCFIDTHQGVHIHCTVALDVSAFGRNSYIIQSG